MIDCIDIVVWLYTVVTPMCNVQLPNFSVALPSVSYSHACFLKAKALKPWHMSLCGCNVLRGHSLPKQDYFSFKLLRLYFPNLGKLELKIPWKHLTKEPLYVEIDDVYVVVGPMIGIEVIFKRFLGSHKYIIFVLS